MAAVCPDEGKSAIETTYISSGTFVLHLYQNNYTPVAGSSSANFTECDFGGYASVNLSGWSSVAIDGSDRGYQTASLASFIADGSSSNTVYGYYMLDPGGKVALAELFASPITMAVAADEIDLTVTFRIGNEC